MKLDAFNMIATEHIMKVLEDSLYMSDHIFNDLPIISVLCDDSGSVIRLNNLAGEYFKLNAKSRPLGKKIWDFFTGDSQVYFEDFFRRKSSALEFMGRESYLELANTEEAVFWQMHCAARVNKEPNIWIIMGTNTRELRRTYEAEIFSLARRNSIMSLSAGIAHEFNNPLTILMALMRRLSLVCDGNQDAERLIEKANFHLDRMSKFVDKFKRFGYDSEDSFEKLSINSVVSNAIDLVRGELETHNIVVKLDLSPKVPDFCGNHHGLIEMLLAIIANSKDALKISNKNEKKITIKTAISTGGVIHLGISDNGAGIDEKNLDCVFDPFFTTKSVGKGEGLGLTLAYSVARSHNGVIKITSKMNEFTEVNVLLPTNKDQKVYDLKLVVEES